MILIFSLPYFPPIINIIISLKIKNDSFIYNYHLILLLFCFLLSSCNTKENEVSNIQASSYVVIEQSTNKILEGSNYDEQRSVASISKIMTAIVAIENIDKNKLQK